MATGRKIERVVEVQYLPGERRGKSIAAALIAEAYKAHNPAHVEAQRAEILAVDELAGIDFSDVELRMVAHAVATYGKSVVLDQLAGRIDVADARAVDLGELLARGPVTPDELRPIGLDRSAEDTRPKRYATKNEEPLRPYLPDNFNDGGFVPMNRKARRRAAKINSRKK